VTFKLPARHNFNILDIYQFEVNGDYANGCEGGDYVQFTVNGKKSKKFCGEGSKLSDEWTYSWPYAFQVVGNPQEPLLVEAVFKSMKRPNLRHTAWYSGFEIKIAAGYEWDSEKPEVYISVYGDGMAMLPMLE